MFDNKIKHHPYELSTFAVGYNHTIQELPKKTVMQFDTLGKNQYSVVGFEMTLTRSTRQFLSVYYMPSACSMLVAGFSFLIPPTAIPGRMTLLLTIFLVQMQMIKDVQSKLPESGVLTGLAFYVLGSILFCFGALTEYAIILLMTRIRDCSFIAENTMKKKLGKNQLDKIDMVAFVFYMTGIIVFNVLYFVFFVQI